VSKTFKQVNIHKAAGTLFIFKNIFYIYWLSMWKNVS
jgi:hypothetical protein